MPNFLGTGTPPRALPRTAEGRMEHVVFFSESSGDSAFRRVPDLEEAVRLVESLRNERGITDVAVHALTPVPVSFRTYYRVEVEASQPASQPVEPAESAPAERVSLERVTLEVPGVEAPALHLLPPPAVQAEWADAERDEVEATDVAIADVDSVEAVSEQSERS